MDAKRTLKVKSAKQLQERIEAYFEACREDDEPVTITGLALAINVSREVLLNWGPDDDCFSMIKQAKLRVQHAYEKRLIKRGNTGDVFALKSFGWSDKPESEKEVKIKTALVAFEDDLESSLEKKEDEPKGEGQIDGGSENTDQI